MAFQARSKVELDEPNGSVILFISLNSAPAEVPRCGAEVRVRQNLLALRRLGYRVHCVGGSDDQDHWPRDIHVSYVEYPKSLGELQLWQDRSLRRQIARSIVDQMSSRQDVIFCEQWPALLCCPRVLHIVYSCHDLESKLMPLRYAVRGKMLLLRRRLYFAAHRWVEWRALRRASSILCVSASEAAWIGCWIGKPAHYIPIAADELQPSTDNTMMDEPRYFFYGTSSATANKVMLNHLRSTLFCRLRQHIPAAEFHQLGSCGRYTKSQISWLREHFVVHDFVDDVTSVMRIGDVCLIPYEHDTGFRTKIPQLYAMGVIPAGYPVSFACCPEMEDDRNSIMGQTPDDLARRMAAVHTDAIARRRLANSAIETFRNKFVWRALRSSYERLMFAKERPAQV